MKAPTKAALRLATRPLATTSPKTPALSIFAARSIHSSSASPATVAPIHGTGPPPPPPRPAPSSADTRFAHRKRLAEILAQDQGLKSKSAAGPGRRRFWKHSAVREVDGALEVHLDARPLRRPTPGKEIVRLPTSKPLLAAALALEWDVLLSVQQATRQHLIPLTSLVCRALDIADEDAKNGETRRNLARFLMRYLDTDSLLCWAPPPRHGVDSPDEKGNSLRELQERAAMEVVGFLTTRVWPGVVIEPVLDGESIVPRGQNAATKRVIEEWIMGLSSWELAGLERAVIAGKGFLGAVRLLVEWSEGVAGVGVEGERSFGVEEAARLASLEVDWQIGNWGAVEDTHDVEREDIRRQFGSIVLLVSGTGKA
ncbi:hypothetical protein GGS21DRAFT_417270 [Xylaria nigripes]|nr:hypothetical protein GGS21DRAFT_417270 [Xylaria nigripes]